MATILTVGSLPAQQPQLPAGYPPGLYDESKVHQYTLPDPLVMLSGEKGGHGLNSYDRGCVLDFADKQFNARERRE